MRSIAILLVMIAALVGTYPIVAQGQAVHVWVEAESADSIVGDALKMYPDDAGLDPVRAASGLGEPSRGHYIGTVPGVPMNNTPETIGGASYSFTVPAGTYAIWARASQAGGDSWWVHVPGGQYNVPVRDNGWACWNWIDTVGLASPDWKWLRIWSDYDFQILGVPATLANVKPFTVTLDAGQHTIHWVNREAGACLDGFLITDDLDLDASTLPAEIPALEAWGPNPASGATEVPRELVLSWGAGELAATHDIYFGKDYDDVLAADRASPLDVLVGRDQTAVTYEPTGLLDWGQTYYWRIDAVGTAPDHAIFKGKVWSFTVVPFGYPIAGAQIVATASSHTADQGPEKTIDESGVANDLHSADIASMWLTDVASSEPHWIQYEFDRPYKLHEMWVWNYNAPSLLSLLGIRNAKVEYSIDAVNWLELANVPEFDQATGAGGYAHNTVVPFDGVMAKYVRITANSNWADGGMFNQYGLSEVRFLYVPVWPKEPNPPAGTANLQPPVMLSWKPGREAASHDIYVSTDQQAVSDSAAPVVTVPSPTYDPAVSLGQKYYWKVVEVNDAEMPSSWESDVWSFSTAQYLIVDNFEGYTNKSPNRVFQTWIDGWGFSPDEFFPNGNNGNGTGAMVGYNPEDGDIMETVTVRGGKQSMPFMYDNAGVAGSEATRTFDGPQDWTQLGIKNLVLYFQADPASDAEQMYVKINGAKSAYRSPGATVDSFWMLAGPSPLWKQWNVDLASLGVDLTAVTTLSLGMGGVGSGTVYFDDIRLYESAPALWSSEELVMRVNFGLGNTPPLEGWFQFLRGGTGGTNLEPPQEETYTTPLGQVTVTLSAERTNLGFRTRATSVSGPCKELGAVIATELLGNVKGGASVRLIVILTGLPAGEYGMLTHHHGYHGVYPGHTRILIDEKDVLDEPLQTSNGTNPERTTAATFRFTAKQGRPVQIVFENLGGEGTGGQPILNGFQLVRVLGIQP